MQIGIATSNWLQFFKIDISSFIGLKLSSKAFQQQTIIGKAIDKILTKDIRNLQHCSDHILKT